MWFIHARAPWISHLLACVSLLSSLMVRAVPAERIDAESFGVIKSQRFMWLPEKQFCETLLGMFRVDDGDAEDAMMRGLCHQYVLTNSRRNLVLASEEFRKGIDHLRRQGISHSRRGNTGNLFIALSTHLGIVSYQLQDSITATQCYKDAILHMSKNASADNIANYGASDLALLHQQLADVVHVHYGNATEAARLYNVSLILETNPVDVSIYWKYSQSLLYSDGQLSTLNSPRLQWQSLYDLCLEALQRNDSWSGCATRMNTNIYLNPLKLHICQLNSMSIVHLAASVVADKLQNYTQAFAHLQEYRNIDADNMENQEDALKRSLKSTNLIMRLFRDGFWPKKDDMCDSGAEPRAAGDNHCFGNPGLVPVFIVGFFRSGSSILESILSAHSNIYGVGEENILAFAMNAISNESIPEGINVDALNRFAALTGHSDSELPVGDAEMTKHDLNFIADKAVQEAMRHANFEYESNALMERAKLLSPYSEVPDDQDAKTASIIPAKTIKRVISKLLSNYKHIGLIHLLFPNALILHTVRDPMDTLFSCYRTKFSHSSTLRTLSDRYLTQEYVQYIKLMQHFREQLPGRVIDVHYEALMTAPEKIIRPIIDKMRLPWEPNILQARKFNGVHKTYTASIFQVRRELYKSSVGYWTKYAVQLQPVVNVLKSALAEHDVQLDPTIYANWNLSSTYDYDGWFHHLSSDFSVPSNRLPHVQPAGMEMGFKLEADLQASEHLTSLIDAHIRQYWVGNSMQDFLKMKPFEYSAKKAHAVRLVHDEYKEYRCRHHAGLALINCSFTSSRISELIAVTDAITQLHVIPETLATQTFSADQVSATLLGLLSAVRLVLASVEGVYRAVADLKVALMLMSSRQQTHGKPKNFGVGEFASSLPFASKMDDYVVTEAHWQELYACYLSVTRSGCKTTSFAAKGTSLLYYMIGDAMQAATTLPPHFSPGPIRPEMEIAYENLVAGADITTYFYAAFMLEPLDMVCLSQFLSTVVMLRPVSHHALNSDPGRHNSISKGNAFSFMFAKRHATTLVHHVPVIISLIGNSLTKLDPEVLQWDPLDGTGNGVQLPERDIEKGSTYRAKTALERISASKLYWNLFKISEYSGDINLAWHHLHTAHKLDASSVYASGYRFDGNEPNKFVDQIVNIYRQGFWLMDDTASGAGATGQRFEKTENDDRDLIFLVGFRRSGINMLLSMLCLHASIQCPSFTPLRASDVDDANLYDNYDDIGVNNRRVIDSVDANQQIVSLLSLLHDNVMNISRSLRLEGSIEIARQTLLLSTTEVRNHIRSLLVSSRVQRSYDGDAVNRRIERYVINLSGHYHYIGLLHLLFPNSVVLHVMRDPMDTIFSSYCTSPLTDSSVWALDMEFTMAQYVGYLKIVKHFRKHLPGRMTEISYESLVVDPEATVRALFAQQIHVPFAYHLLSGWKQRPTLGSKGRKQKASSKPKSFGGVGNWVKYKNHLEPVAKALRGYIHPLGGRVGGKDSDSITTFVPVATAKRIAYFNGTGTGGDSSTESLVTYMYAARKDDIVQNWKLDSRFDYGSLLEAITEENLDL
jgi:tetratricopeptide (TPR) repeat protein